MDSISRDGYVEFEKIRPTKYLEMDLMSREGAEWLKGKIRDFWAKRGALVDVRVERIFHQDGSKERQDRRAFYVVRTDMVNGLPRRWQ